MLSEKFGVDTMTKITTTKTHTSGIALGGIGSGSVELLPDGEFHYWQIANPPRLTSISNEKKVDDGEGSTGALSFWVREKKKDARPIVRKLGMKTDTDDFTYRMFAWNKPVERIHKFNFRKQTLHKKYGLPLTMTESKMAKELGYYKIWDCGLYRYVWKK